MTGASNGNSVPLPFAGFLLLLLLLLVPLCMPEPALLIGISWGTPTFPKHVFIWKDEAKLPSDWRTKPKSSATDESRPPPVSPVARRTLFIIMVLVV